jgi:MbtH protein
MSMQYWVVVNDEEQYSIWPVGRDMPLGWTAVGEPADEESCLDWIEQNWTDIRPKSIRERALS